MTHPTGFFLYHGNQLPRLAKALGNLLAEPADGCLLKPDTVLIPQPSMRRWLQNSLAEQFGIAANIDFSPPGSFINGILQPWLASQDERRILNPERLRWRIFQALSDPSLLNKPAFQQVRQYLDQQQVKAWQLSGELADSFEKYQAWRRPWLLAWSRNPPADDWQAQLWQQASAGYSYRAQAVAAYLKALNNPDCARPAGLPNRLAIFACQNLSPDVLHVLQSFGRWSAVHFYLHNPCEAYWGDVKNPRSREEILAFQGDNPLLNQWGFAGRDFVASLLSEQSEQWAGEQDDYLPNSATADNLTTHNSTHDLNRGLLHCIQDDVLYRNAPEISLASFSRDSDDGSIQIHSCHSSLREVQALHAQLLALMHKDPTLQWRDIAIMAPNLENYAPFFAPVFGQQNGHYPALPFTLSDQALYQDAELADLFFKLLTLGQSRFTSNEGYELLCHPLVAKYYQ